MKFTLGILCVLVVCSASAQTTTLEYQGYVMGGTSSYPTDPPTFGANGVEKFQVSSTTGTFTAEVVLSGSVANADLAVTSFSINLAGGATSGQTLGLFGILSPDVDPVAGTTTSSANETCYEGSGGYVTGCITILTNQKNKIIGAKLSLEGAASQSPEILLSIGPGGDAFTFTTFTPAGPLNCSIPTFLVASYYGSPCEVKIRNPTKGIWTVKTQ